MSNKDSRESASKEGCYVSVKTKCPFDGPTDLKPEDPCPECGMLGFWTDDDSKCVWKR